MTSLKWYKIVIDCTLFVLVGIPIILVNRIVYPFKRGFYCDDRSIMYPFKESTIPYALVVGLGIGIPIVTFIICESLIFVQCKRQELSSGYHAIKRLHCVNLHPLVYILYYITGVFLFGALITQMTTDVVKYTGDA
ncbi:phospholipid phosphatase 1-like isoform X2 [Ptychodera flava]|uniref:phospholipid phosphatase 1-like isoform X2 n=1 Tax=Ptychodera flava TaxID=63121 RepID=UPI00396A1BC0